MMKRYKYLNSNKGSISHGTMRPEDLIPEFVSYLEDQKPLKREHAKLIKEINERMGSSDYFGDSPDDIVQFDLDELFDALEEYCLPYFYFGAHPGDGSDYGFWLSESFESDFDGLKVSDLAEVPKGHSGEVLLVNDHGNCTLYQFSNGRKWEVWSVV